MLLVEFKDRSVKKPDGWLSPGFPAMCWPISGRYSVLVDILSDKEYIYMQDVDASLLEVVRGTGLEPALP